MSMPNNVGYIAECQEDRALVRDEETNSLVPGDTALRFKLKLRNTFGHELIVWAVLEDASLSNVAEVGQFYSEGGPAFVRVGNNTIDELIGQLKADLSGEKDAHDLAVDHLESQPEYAQLTERLAARLEKHVEEYLARRLG